MRGTLTSWSIFLAVLCGSALYNGLGLAKEVEVTKEWKLLGENDTIPAGMHVRMDMTTGEKWVKLVDENDDDSHMAAVVIQPDGSVEVADEEQENDNYDYEMMHRTLSKLPEEEQERFGGLPELPQSGDNKITLTSKEREAFEKRMEEIWQKRQAKLKELQDSTLDLPDILKARIRSIQNYLKDPVTHLNDMKLDHDEPEDGFVSHIVSVLQDLESHLADIDMARDFHTLGGWPLLASLLSESVHTPQNETIAVLSTRSEANMRTVQAHAAWAVGTTVKNTGEFFPYAIEEMRIQNVKTTAVDLLIDVFCEDYKDPRLWEIRTMLGKSLYGIGALLRGNRMAQIHVCERDSSARLGDKLRKLSLANFNSANTKLIQRLLSLSGDIVSDVKLHSEHATEELNNLIIDCFTNSDWCGSVENLLLSDAFFPVQVQDTLLRTVDVLAPHCVWKDKADGLLKSIENMLANYQENKDDFDDDHFKELLDTANQAKASVSKSKGR